MALGLLGRVEVDPVPAVLTPDVQQQVRPGRGAEGRRPVAAPFARPRGPCTQPLAGLRGNPYPPTVPGTLAGHAAIPCRAARYIDR